MTITCVTNGSRLRSGALLMAVKQCELIATLCRLPRAAEQALSIAAVHQLTLELDSVNQNNNHDSDGANNKRTKNKHKNKHDDNYNSSHNNDAYLSERTAAR